LENRRDKDNEMYGRMWEVVETEARKVRMAEAKGRRIERRGRKGGRKETRGEGAEEKEKEKTKEGENNGSKKSGRRMRDLG